MSSFDLVIKNGTVITMDDNLSLKRWVAVDNGKITAVGDHDDFAGDAGVTVDLAGRTLMPGLIDTHAHGTLTGIGNIGIELGSIYTSKEVLDAVRTYCAENPAINVICGCNMHLAEEMKDGKVPTRFELDEIEKDRPIVLVLWTGHGGILNSKALELSYLEGTMINVGETGYFNEDKAYFHIIANLYNLFTDDDFENIYSKVAKHCASVGITTMHSLDGMTVKGDRDAEALRKCMDRMPIGIVNYTQTFDWEKINGYGIKQIGGCLSLDGSPPQITAAYLEPYPASPNTRGLLNYTDKELYEFVSAASKVGMQVSFHAIGDRAIDQIIHIYQQVDREIGIKDLRHRIEHFSVPTDKHIEMAAEMNIVASSQPAIANMLDGINGNAFEGFVSKEKAVLHENFGRVLRGGVIVSGGSDSPVTPLDAFFGINAAVNAYKPYRRVTLDDALKMYTKNAAWAAHQENIKGSLEPGKQADMIIVDKNPYEVIGCIDRSVINVEETYVRGRQVYKKEAR